MTNKGWYAKPNQPTRIWIQIAESISYDENK